MSARRPVLALAALALLAVASHAHALGVLTTGKRAVIRSDSALVRVGRDRLLPAAAAAVCRDGVVPHLTLSSYPVATARVTTHLDVDLPCGHWTPRKDGVWRYDGGVPGDGVVRLDLGPTRLVIELGGDGYRPATGPVGYVQAWIVLGDQRLDVRFHNFRVNDATVLATRRPSRAAAEGEAAFWDVLHGDDHSEARQQAALAALGRAARRDRADGRSRFLVGMLHLYRFGQRVGAFSDADADAEAELAAAVDAFDPALPLLWNATDGRGDSRVPGFVAAARWALGRVRNDAALEARGLAELDAAVAVNRFFNVFDLIPVAQAVGSHDPQLALVLDRVLPYLNDAETLACITTQPEICANAGLAPHGIAGALMLFGDLYAKGGMLAQAQQWYGLAAALTDAGYRFRAQLDDRAAHAAARVAAWQDADPTNDPLVIGAREEACANCHTK